MVSTEINNGTGLVLYCGHGSQGSWGTSGFSSTNVNALTNAGKLPFIWSVACVNGDFVSSTCFAESWLRANQGGQPTGAMAFLGSTINQSWNSPMCGQDEMTDILAESYASNIKRTFAGISLNGCMKMIDEYGTDGADMADTWTVFGDPTLQVRTSLPENLVVTNDATVFVGSTTLHVTCNTDGARASVTLNDSLLATGIVANHFVNLTFPALPAPNDSLHLVVTAYNHLPYITDIPIITPNGPYILYSSNHVNDTTGNNNHMADYDENILLTLYVKNVGVLPSSDVTVKLRSNDSYITLNDTTDNYGIIAGQISDRRVCTACLSQYSGWPPDQFQHCLL
jgi:Peptidase family C25/Peptidase family C25, C terminal ig-like domain